MSEEYEDEEEIIMELKNKIVFLEMDKENLKNELDKKDKVIDLMAKMINSHDIDDDICGQFGKDKDCSDFTNEELCVDCIKEYFYKKVEGENMSKNEIKLKCHWCGNDLDIKKAYTAGNARGYGIYIECEKCGKNKVLNEIDLTREMNYVEDIRKIDDFFAQLTTEELDLKLEKGKAVCFDFDGVIHKYSKGWQDGSIYDKYNKEVLDLILLLQKIGIPVFICSTRSPLQIVEWWNKNIINPKVTLIGEKDKFWNSLEFIGVTNKKLPAQLYIDDRAYKYTGQSMKDILLDLSK